MKKDLVCTTCGHYGAPKKHTKGSTLIEIVLWLFFIIPGIIYGIWRVSTRSKVCAKCGSNALVPADSPVGRRLLADNSKM